MSKVAEINRLRFKYRLVCPECLFGFFLNENMYRHAQFKKQNKKPQVVLLIVFVCCFKSGEPNDWELTLTWTGVTIK